MIEFNLHFTGYMGGKLHSFTCSRTFDTLPHSLQEGSTLLLEGEEENDDVSLIVMSVDMKQHAGKLRSSIEWEIDTSFEGSFKEPTVEKIRRVLLFNSWSCEAHAI